MRPAIMERLPTPDITIAVIHRLADPGCRTILGQIQNYDLRFETLLVHGRLSTFIAGVLWWFYPQ
jgi:hypothetical protein